jgi:hypothetical protein
MTTPIVRQEPHRYVSDTLRYARELAQAGRLKALHVEVTADGQLQACYLEIHPGLAATAVGPAMTLRFGAQAPSGATTAVENGPASEA